MIRPIAVALALITTFAVLQTQAVPAITSPGASDRVRVGSDLHIAWSDLGTGLLNLHYQKGGTDTNWYSISSTVQATPGQYNNWQVLPLPGNMRIRATATDGPNILYYYSGIFTVVQLDLTAPGFLTSWAANSTQNITWTYSNNAVASVKLEYTLNSLDSIPTWVTIRDSVPITPATFAWTVPNFNTSFARVRIREIHSNSVIHTGNAFAITGATGIQGAGVSTKPGLRVEGSRAGFTLDATGHARVDLLDAQGKVTAVLMDGPQAAGTHWVNIDSARFPAGIYTVRLRSGNTEASQRFVVTR
jgi:hypothetical protein